MLFALTSSILLTANGVLLYQSLKSHLETTAAEDITTTITAIRSRLAQLPDETSVAENNSGWFDPFHAHDNMELAIFAEDNRLLVHSHGFLLTPGLLVWDPAQVVEEIRKDGLRYISSMVLIADGAQGQVRLVIQYSDRRQIALLRAYALSVTVVTLLGTLASALAAYLVVKFALRPLKTLAVRADQMSSSGLSKDDPPFLLTDVEMAGELQALSRSFNRMLERLHDSFVRLSRFSSDLAHDIRTPLTNLLAEAQVALSKPRSAAEYRAVIESSVDEAQRLSRLIDDMLFLARAENNNKRLNFQLMDGRGIAERVAGYYEMLAADADVHLSVQGKMWLMGELSLVQRALSNVLSNALKHAPAGSEVVIACQESLGWREFAITDWGPGIAVEHQSRIFDRFYRVDPVRHNSTARRSAPFKRGLEADAEAGEKTGEETAKVMGSVGSAVAGGTGLGLAIVKSIMSEHGGECILDSEEGVRTTFMLRFPHPPCRDAVPVVKSRKT